MKCIRCNHDSKYRDRQDGRCPNCKKPFAFEPQRGGKVTDAAFQAAIDAVSGRGRLRWGVEHLYYDVCRRLNKKAMGGCFKVAGILAIIGIFGLGGEQQVLLWGFVAAAVAVMIGFSQARAASLSKTDFDQIWRRWCEVHGTPESVIVRKPRPRSERTAEPDLEQYSFDRAVICDRARTVDLLLANNFHFENNCAVLAVHGYPAGPFELVRKMLRRNPRLHAFALHDATPEGCRLAHQLANDPAWFKDQAMVTDVGLRPLHAGPFKRLLLPGSGPVVAGDGISSLEAEWLSKHTLELAVIRPEQVLKRLFKAINRKADDGGGGGNGDGGGSVGTSRDEDEATTEGCVDYDSDSFGSDADSGDGGADGFG